MTFSELLLERASRDADLKDLTADEILDLLDRTFPKDRRGRLSPHAVAAIEPPPAILRGIKWSDGAYHAESPEDVQQIVAFARTSGRRVRVAGAQHSTPDAVYSPDRRDLRVVLAGSLRLIDPVKPDERGATVRVGAGCYLGINPMDPSSNAGNSLTRVLDAQGYALPVLGGISHQTVGGFLQTSSAGGSLCHGFADAVEGIELVNGCGEVELLSAGSEALNAAAVSVGLLGVIIRVVLRLIPRYYVEGTETNHEEAQSLLQPDGTGQYPLSDALVNSEYLHLDWFPQRYVHRVTQWTGTRTDAGPPVYPYESELKNGWMNVIAALVLEITSGALAVDPDSWLVQHLVGVLLQKFVPLDRSAKFRDTWVAVLPCDDQVRVDTLIKIIFTEIWLPLDQLSIALDRLKTLLKDQAAAGNFAVELYGARHSPFWLSPSYLRDVVRVDVFWWAYSFGDPREHFTHFWNALLELPGARLHWGKQLPDVGKRYGRVTFDVNFLHDAYPRLGDWLELRATKDPDGVFLTEYWRRIFGLETR